MYLCMHGYTYTLYKLKQCKNKENITVRMKIRVRIPSKTNCTGIRLDSFHCTTMLYIPGNIYKDCKLYLGKNPRRRSLTCL